MDQQEGIAPDTWETDVPAEGDGPRVWITLPDQQVVREHVQTGGRDQAQPTSIVTTVPATHVEGIERERYDASRPGGTPSPALPPFRWAGMSRRCARQTCGTI